MARIRRLRMCVSVSIMAVVLNGCVDAGRRGGLLGPPEQQDQGQKAGLTVFCVLTAPFCAGALAVVGIQSLLPKNDPQDPGDPERSTREKLVACYQDYKARPVPQWASFERCEEEPYESWASQFLNDAPIRIGGAERQNHIVIEQARRGIMPLKEALLQWQVIMEESVMDVPYQGRVNGDIDKDALRKWQSAQCEATYSGADASTMRLRSLCLRRVTLAWRRRSGLGDDADDAKESGADIF